MGSDRIHELEEALEHERAAKRMLQADRARLSQALQGLQLRAEQQEEAISNTLLRRLQQVEAEKAALEERGGAAQHLEEQLGRLRLEKVQLENTLEQECEFAVNRLAKEKDNLAAANRALQERLQEEGSSSQSSSSLSSSVTGGVSLLPAGAKKRQSLSAHDDLEREVLRLRLMVAEMLAERHRAEDGLCVDGNTALKTNAAGDSTTADTTASTGAANIGGKAAATLMSSSTSKSEGGFDGDTAVLRQENATLRRRLAHATQRVAELERALAGDGLAQEMDEERQFNLARSFRAAYGAEYENAAAIAISGNPSPVSITGRAHTPLSMTGSSNSAMLSPSPSLVRASLDRGLPMTLSPSANSSLSSSPVTSWIHTQHALSPPSGPLLQGRARAWSGGSRGSLRGRSNSMTSESSSISNLSHVGSSATASGGGSTTGPVLSPSQRR